MEQKKDMEPKTNDSKKKTQRGGRKNSPLRKSIEDRDLNQDEQDQITNKEEEFPTGDQSGEDRSRQERREEQP
jgi:hypothetical protein